MTMANMDEALLKVLREIRDELGTLNKHMDQLVEGASDVQNKLDDVQSAIGGVESAVSGIETAIIVHS